MTCLFCLLWHPILNHDLPGLFLSNGPGDPTRCTATIANLRTALKMDRPIFGICLGNQLLALAAGAKTYKMKFGNRGVNQPCIDLRTTLCYITSQNHVRPALVRVLYFISLISFL